MKIAAPLALAAALLGTACGGSSGGFRAALLHGESVEDAVTLEVPSGAARELEVTTSAGDVEVLPGAGDGPVRVVARRFARTPEDLARIRILAREEGGVLRVGYEVEGEPASAGVSFAVEAPPRLALRLRSSAGSVLARGFDAGMEARTSAGNVVADGVRGDLHLESSAGSVAVSGADGALAARTSAGNVEVSGRLRGACVLRSGAGNITATLPREARLRVTARTSAGDATSEFPLESSRDGARGRMEGSLGDGEEGTLEMRSAAGNVRLRKAP